MLEDGSVWSAKNAGKPAAVRVSIKYEEGKTDPGLKDAPSKTFTLGELRTLREASATKRGWSDQRVPKWPPERQWAAWALYHYIPEVYAAADAKTAKKKPK